MSKETIKKVALSFFAESGYEATSLAKIAAEVGIKKPSIYAHFASKEELFLEVYQDAMQLELKQSKLLKKQGLNNASLLKALFYYLTDIHTDKLEKQFLQRATFYPPEAIADNVKKICNTFESLTMEFMQSAMPITFTKKKQIEWMNVFYMLIDGLLIEESFYKEEEFLERRKVAWIFLSEALVYKEE